MAIAKTKGILKTMTLGYEDNPTISLCPGHVSAETFDEAFLAEGWSDSDVADEDLRYEYWVRTKTNWKRSSPENEKAMPVTVMDW
jgi:hypothetical protein